MPHMQRRRVAVCEESELKRNESVLTPSKALVLSGGFVFFRFALSPPCSSEERSDGEFFLLVNEGSTLNALLAKVCVYLRKKGRNLSKNSRFLFSERVYNIGYKSAAEKAVQAGRSKNMTIIDIGRVHALSCVEAYFGAWIKDYAELPALYAESYLPWEEIVTAFETPSVCYANFPYLPRIQDCAERYGMVTHRRERGLPQRRNNGDLMLLYVSEKFFEKQQPWRGDGCVAVEITDCGVKYFNGYPLESGEIPRAEFVEKSVGESLVYSLAEADAVKKSGVSRLQSPCRASSSCGADFNLKRLRDAIGVLRVSRKRTVEWLDWYAQEHSVKKKEKIRNRLAEQIRYADGCFVRLQGALIRNERVGSARLKEMAKQIAALDEPV